MQRDVEPESALAVVWLLTTPDGPAYAISMPGALDVIVVFSRGMRF
ncbi:hypothetical protein PUN4_180132 [Paraburkholderia unamae]|nr:hypothetical protein PUN4_180132 [Paraburkholderia unamae]